MNNIGLFIIFLMVAGSIYGLVWAGGLFILNFKKTKKEIKRQFENVYLRYAFFAGIILFALSYLNFVFLFASVFAFASILLFVFAKTIENCVLVKDVIAGKLREGDWLVDDIRIGKKVIRADWEGLSKEDIEVLKKRGRKIRIKEGLPFVPSFLLAFLLWSFKDKVIGFLGGLV